MVNIKIIIALICFITSISYGQNKSFDEKIEIHQIVSKSFKRDGTKFTLNTSTDKSILNGFDFSGGGRGLDTISKKIYNTKEWTDFIKSIDTATIKEYQLNFKNNRARKNKGLLTFAPIIFSKDHKKALCISRLYSFISNSGQVNAWYLEQEKSVWKIIDTQLLILLD